MIDYRIGCDECDEREDDFTELIGLLFRDLQKLELRIVRLRYLLSGYLPEHDGKMPREEIFSDLAGGYCDCPAYRRYVSGHCGRREPMECAAYVERMKKNILRQRGF